MELKVDYSKTREACTRAADLLEEKAKNYGPSFKAVAEIMRVLFPNGIPVAAYGDAGLMIRVLDKFARLAYSKRREDDALWGTLVDRENPWKDILGYAALAVEANGGWSSASEEAS